MKNPNSAPSGLTSNCSNATLSPITVEKQGAPSFPNYLFAGLVMLAAFVAIPAHAQRTTPAVAPPAPTDVTFAFTTDAHVSFDLFDDHQGIEDDVTDLGYPVNDLLLIKNETALSQLKITQHHDGCVGSGFDMEKDLCNQIQLVRKLNHLPDNSWSDASFTQPDGHKATLRSAGETIQAPKGVIIAGDLTDCGAGSPNTKVYVGPWPWDWDSENCDINYGNGQPGAELAMFKQLFDQDAHTMLIPLDLVGVIQGLKTPDRDTPLKYPIYPHLGNHDLGFEKSGEMMNYIAQWSSAIPAGEPRHVTNSDPKSLAYSWDWGRLHIVNVGLFAGSSNASGATPSTNYPYSQEAMDWLAKDLATYAADGRPVIISQHFGFDPYTSNSWGYPNGSFPGATNIWATLAPYNVIAVLHGHQHAQWFYSFHPNDFYIGKVLAPNPNPRLAYDIFEIGAGFLQDFGVLRVTDNFMDVQATLQNSDFDNTRTKVEFVPDDGSNPAFFTKRLVQPPTIGKIAQVDGNNTLATSVATGGKQLLVGSNLLGRYTVRAYASTGTTTVDSTGNFPLIPKFLFSYTQSNQAYVLVTDGETLYDYLLTPQGILKEQWKDSTPINSMTVLYTANARPYLAVDEGSDGVGVIKFSFFELQPNQMRQTETFTPGGKEWTRAQMVTIQQRNSEEFQLVHYDANGNVSIYSGSISEGGDAILRHQGDEIWMADSSYQLAGVARSNVLIQPVTLKDGSAAIFVKAANCVLYNDNDECATQNTQDSPYTVRTFTQDGTGTEVAWRGAFGGSILASSAIAAVPLPSSTGVPVVGLYGSNGILLPVSINGSF